MAEVMLTRRVALGTLGAGGGLAVLAACKIVPIAETGGQDAGFDAKGYAGELWTSEALPHFELAARPVAEVLTAIAADIGTAGSAYGYRPATEGSPWSFVVSGRGMVTAKNTASRAGTLTVAVEGTAPPLEVVIQIGPVVRGNAVRDSLPFVSFKDFTNQLEFADVGKAFTALAVARTTAAAQAAAAGDTVTFLGVMSLNTSSERILVTPVSLQAGG